jgi:cytochrome P450 family 6
MNLVKEIVEYREKNNFRRNDFMDLLIQLKNQGYVSADKEGNDNDESIDENSKTLVKKLSLNEITAQAFVFFLASFETSSAGMFFTLFEIVKHPEILSKVQEEIDQVFGAEGITYDSVKNLKYLDCCMMEALRMYPAVPLITRECTKDYKIPKTDLVVKKGVQIQIPAISIQRDPQVYDNPLEFKPERFLDSPDGHSKAKGISFLTFGDGPRHCNNYK